MQFIPSFVGANVSSATTPPDREAAHGRRCDRRRHGRPSVAVSPSDHAEQIAQLTALTSDQIAAIETIDIAAMKTAQVASLNLKNSVHLELRTDCAQAMIALFADGALVLLDQQDRSLWTHG